MKRTRRTFSRDFKLTAVRYANSGTDHSMTSIADELEIDRQALWAWIREVEVKGEELAFPGSGRRQSSLLPTSGVPAADHSLDALDPLRAENEMLREKLDRTIAERDAFRSLLEQLIGTEKSDSDTKEAQSDG